MRARDGEGKFRTPGVLKDIFLPMREAVRRITRLYDNYLGSANLTAAQFTILAYLRENGPMSLGELGAVSMCKRTSLLQVLRPLMRAELVQKTQEKDPRKPVFSLSDLGVERHSVALPLWWAAQSAVGRLIEHGNPDSVLSRFAMLAAGLNTIGPVGRPL